MYGKLLIALGVLACGVYSLETCFCPIVSQKQAFDKADVVGKIQVQKRNQTQDQVTYDVTFQQLFKPNNARNDTRQLVTPLLTNKCGVPALAIGQTYLIAATNNGSRLAITSCGSIPPRPFSRPVGPTLWSAVNAQLLKKLESGKFVI